jgi:hypothetical protein
MAFESQAGLYINIKSRNIYTWYRYKLMERYSVQKYQPTCLQVDATIQNSLCLFIALVCLKTMRSACLKSVWMQYVSAKQIMFYLIEIRFARMPCVVHEKRMHLGSIMQIVRMTFDTRWRARWKGKK